MIYRDLVSQRWDTSEINYNNGCLIIERPLGSDSFIEMAELLLGRNLKKKKPGPKVFDDDN
jgi:hypothetical protein